MNNKAGFKELIFNSRNDPVPGLRGDLDIIPVKENGHTYLYFHDVMGYATPDFALDSRAYAILSLLDGRRSLEDFKPYLGNGTDTRQLLSYVQFLDENRLLYSPYFKKYSDFLETGYEATDIHHSNTAGISYPSDPAEVRKFLDEAFNTFHQTVPHSGTIRGLYAPHIDPRVGIESYVQAFAPLRDLTPERVVILATSHYAGLHPRTYQHRPFITTKKDFKLPLATIRTDKEAVGELLDNGPDIGLSSRDRAHRIEHSIELHLLFLSYLWNHDFKIIPILVRGFDELYYMANGHLAGQVENLGSVLRNKFGNDEDTLFLISGDLAHIGRKFGDEQPARALFDEVRNFDHQFMQYAAEGNDTGMLNLMKEAYDPYRICGFPPLYTFLKTMPGLKGCQLSYDLWDEAERDSAVTFGSILYSE